MKIEDYNVHVCRKGNLVYLASLKAASTYYKSVFVYNGWDAVSFNNINWETDHVFGFISNPITRYLKALAEDYFNEETEELVADPEFQELLQKIVSRHRKQCFVLTYHSLPLSITLGKYARLVDWIPIGDGFPAEEVFSKLCEKYSITLDYTLDNIDPHVSTPNKLLVYENLKSLFGEGNYFRDLVLAQDIDLYNEVKSKINTNGSTWDEVSWLNK